MPTLLEIGDALLAERVAISARRLGRRRVVVRTNRHKAEEIIARDDVYCVIEMPLRAKSKQA